VSHVLIFGQTPHVAELKARLKGWGMTSGDLLLGSGQPHQVSVDDCDAVVLDLRGNSHPVWIKDFLVDHEQAAPVLVLRESNSPSPAACSYWVDLAGDDTGDARVLLELQRAIAHSRQKRGLGAGSPGGSYLHFLGHELRSPLTAAKTALEALQGELSGELDSSVDARALEASLKMTAIAVRNIQRLQQTVEWSQDLLAHMETVDAEEEPLESSILL
jgi:signal transduction histidine kinase